jgi:hypothetical protein
MWSRQAQVHQDDLTAHLEATYRSLARDAGKTIKHTKDDVEIMLDLFKRHGKVKVGQVMEKEEPWRLVGGKKRMNKNEEMKKKLGDDEEQWKVILWEVPAGMKMEKVIAAIVEGVSMEMKEQLMSVKRVAPGTWASRVEVTIAPSAYERWKGVLHEVAGKNGWQAKSGRKFQQRLSDRMWKEATEKPKDTKEQKVTVWSWNACGLVASKLAELEQPEVKKPLIIAVQETWLYETFTPKLAEYTWLGRATTRKDKGRARGGTGFFIHDCIANFSRLAETHTDRVTVLEYESRASKVYLINVYAPTTSEAPIAARREFFDIVEGLVHKYAARGETVLMGDMNARMGNKSSVIGEYNESTCNDNEPLFRQMLINTGMVALNGRTPCETAEWTHIATGASGITQSVLDYVCVRANMIDRCRASPRSERFSSDHFVIEAYLSNIILDNKARTARESIKEGKKSSRPNFHPLIHNFEGARENYEAACANNFASWTDEFENITTDSSLSKQDAVNKMHLSIIERIKTAVHEGVPHSTAFVSSRGTIRRHFRWHDKDVVKTKAHREVLRRELIQEASENDDAETLQRKFDEYTAACKAVRSLIKQKKQQREGDFQMSLLDDPPTNPQRYYNTPKRLRDGNNRASTTRVASLINPTTGREAKTDDDIREAFRAAAETLYNEKGDLTKFDEEDYKMKTERHAMIQLSLDAECQARQPRGEQQHWYNKKITLAEIRDAANELEYYKATDRDDIRSEFFIFADETALSAMTDMCNFIADHGVAPSGWQTGSITMLPKPGDSKLATNYRGITVLSIVRKLLDRALNNRLSKNVTICPEQDGFRKNHSCPDQIWMLQSMIDQARARKMPLFACFVDFKKAYDRVWRDLLTIKLHDQAGVQGKVLRAILAMLKDSKGEIRYGGKASEYFAIAMGVAQGPN